MLVRFAIATFVSPFLRWTVKRAPALFPEAATSAGRTGAVAVRTIEFMRAIRRPFMWDKLLT